MTEFVQRLHAPLLALALLLVPSLAAAQYPERPVRIIVPFVPGGTIDLFARQLQQRIAPALGQPIVVDNRGGGGGAIGTEAVVRAEPDGHTILLHSGGVITDALLKANPRYDVRRDLAPITLAAVGPFALMVNPQLPVRSAAELVRYAKQNPGKLNYSSSGIGSSVHMTTELFASVAGVQLTHVPYKGGAQSVNAVVANEVQMAFVSLPIAKPLAAQGRMRAIGISGTAPSALWPELEPISKTLAGFDATVWVVAFAPARTPAPVVARLNSVIAAALSEPDMLAWMRDNGLDRVADSPEEFKQKVNTDVERWTALVKKANITVP